MITGLTIRPTFGDPLTLSMPRGRDGYQVRRIEGLDPVPVSVATSALAQIDGDKFLSSRREKRNIVIDIKLDLNYEGSSIEARRNRLSVLGIIKQDLLLEFTTLEYGTVHIVGRLETLESPSYTESPHVQMSIICPDPDFYTPGEKSITGMLDQDPVNIHYTGTQPVGMVIEIDHNTQSGFGWPNIQLRHNDLVTGNMIGRTNLSTDGRTWGVSSVVGDKYIRAYGIHQGEATSWINYWNLDTMVWATLYPGQNVFSFTSNRTNTTVPWGFFASWRRLYGSI